MHDVKGLVSSTSAIHSAAQHFQSAVVCPLALDFALLPLTDALRAEIEEQHSSSERLPRSPVPEVSNAIHVLALQISLLAPVAYVSTEYYGGTGGQDALAWQRGRISFSPTSGGYNRAWPNSPISQALRAIGVLAVEGRDEFDTIELGRYRETHRWASAHERA